MPVPTHIKYKGQFITPYSPESEAKIKAIGWLDNGGLSVNKLYNRAEGRIVLIFEPTLKVYRALTTHTKLTALFIPTENLSEALLIGSASVEALYEYAKPYGKYDVHKHSSHARNN